MELLIKEPILARGTLFPNIINRPIWNSAMGYELAKYVGGILNEWCNNDSHIDDCIKAAEKVLPWNIYEDGYKLAKEFEDEGFDSDAQLVEELDNVWSEKDTILDDHIKGWVLNNGIELTLPIGTKVSYITNQKKISGEIVKIYPETARYGVWSADLDYEKGQGHRIINGEAVTIL